MRNLLGASLLPLALLSAVHAKEPNQPLPATQAIASLASSGDAVHLWRLATDCAAAAVVEALRKQDPSMSVELLQGTDLSEDALRIWHGQSVTLGLEADGQTYRYVVSSEEDWKSLAQVLPAQQGGLLHKTDWDSVQHDWLSPMARGSVLPDFALEGPVDIFLSQPTVLQLFLPHASDAGTVRRVLLRHGAAVMVRGARSVRLRRGLHLPAIGLSEFAGIVTSDVGQQQPLGVLHLLAGVRKAAAVHWNASHPDQSLGLVALEVDLSPLGSALLAAPTSSGGGSQRLRVRRVKEGVVELLPRDGPLAGGVAAEGAVVVPQQTAPSGAWPLTSVHPSQLQSYERLLRQLISSRLFRAPKGGQQQLRAANDIQLRLLETKAQAIMVLQMKLELERRPKAQPQEDTKVGGATDPTAEGTAAEAAGGGTALQQQQQQQGTVAVAQQAATDEALDVYQMVTASPSRLGPFEEWTATVQIKGDAQRGTLKFVPLYLQRTGVSHDTFHFSQGALNSLYDMNRTQLAFG